MYTTLTEADTLTARERYRMELAQLPQLDRAQERDLVARARAGEAQARVDLVESCLAYVMQIAGKYARRAGLDLLDVVQAGNLRMVERLDAALEAVNPRAFLYVTARGAVINYCYEFSSLIRVPPASYGRGARPARVISMDTPLYDDEITLADLIEA